MRTLHFSTWSLNLSLDECIEEGLKEKRETPLIQVYKSQVKANTKPLNTRKDHERF